MAGKCTLYQEKRLMPRKFICFKPFTLRLDYGETICLINLWKKSFGVTN